MQYYHLMPVSIAWCYRVAVWHGGVTVGWRSVRKKPGAATKHSSSACSSADAEQRFYVAVVPAAANTRNTFTPQGEKTFWG